VEKYLKLTLVKNVNKLAHFEQLNAVNKDLEELKTEEIKEALFVSKSDFYYLAFNLPCKIISELIKTQTNHLTKVTFMGTFQEIAI